MPTAPRTHKQPSAVAKRDYQRQYDANRPTAYQRGYDKGWNELRRAFLTDNPLCVDCMRKDLHYTPAIEVHHIIKIKEDPSLRLTPSNLMPLCKRHHSQRTAQGE